MVKAVNFPLTTLVLNVNLQTWMVTAIWNYTEYYGNVTSVWNNQHYS